MIERCWRQLNAEMLANFGCCTCETECERKRQIVDELMDALEHEDVNMLTLLLYTRTKGMPDFAGS